MKQKTCIILEIKNLYKSWNKNLYNSWKKKSNISNFVPTNGISKFRLISRALNITGDIKIAKQSLNCRTLHEILHFQLRGFIATDEVIEYWVIMYAYPLLIVQVMYFTSKGQFIYNSSRGWFLKIFKWRICFPCNY